MDEQTRILWEMLIRLAKGMLTALEKWVKSKTEQQ